MESTRITVDLGALLHRKQSMNISTRRLASFALALLGILATNTATAQWVEHSLSGHGERVNLLLPAGDRVYAGFHGGVDQSFDGGLTWESAGTGIGNEVDVHALKFDSKGRMFMATEPGVYVSMDSGRTWAVAKLNFMKSNLLSFDVVDSILFAGSSEGIYLSRNGGRNWRLDSVSSPSKQVNSLLTVRNVLFAGSRAGLYTSADTGRTWVLSSAGMPVDPLIRELRVIGDSDIYALVSQDVYHSTDQGQSWSSVQGDLRDQQYFGIARFEDTLYASTQYGIFRSVVGSGNWVDYSEGIEDSLFYDIRFVNGRLLAAGNDGHVYTRDLRIPASVDSRSAGGKLIGLLRSGSKLSVSVEPHPANCKVVVVDILGTSKVEYSAGSSHTPFVLDLHALVPGKYFVTSKCLDQAIPFIW